MPIYRKEWYSKNGKYFILVRKFEDDPQVLIAQRAISNGRKRPIRYKDLPMYVKSKIKELRKAAREVIE